MKNEPFVIERVIDAPVDRVWQAITDKEKMNEWYFNIVDFKLEKGFKFQFYGQDHEGRKILHVCEILEVIKNRKFKHSWTYPEFGDGYSTVTWELYDENSKTRVKLTHEGLESFPQNDPSFRRESFAEGWTYIVGKGLPEYLSK